MSEGQNEEQSLGVGLLSQFTCRTVSHDAEKKILRNLIKDHLGYVCEVVQR